MSPSPKRFAASDDSQGAFGLNLLGAIVGGCLEYAALLTGYNNLLILVAGLYLFAFLLRLERVAGSSGGFHLVVPPALGSTLRRVGVPGLPVGKAGWRVTLLTRSEQSRSPFCRPDRRRSRTSQTRPPWRHARLACA